MDILSLFSPVGLLFVLLLATSLASQRRIVRRGALVVMSLLIIWGIGTWLWELPGLILKLIEVSAKAAGETVVEAGKRASNAVIRLFGGKPEPTPQNSGVNAWEILISPTLRLTLTMTWLTVARIVIEMLWEMKFRFPEWKKYWWDIPTKPPR